MRKSQKSIDCGVGPKSLQTNLRCIPVTFLDQLRPSGLRDLDTRKAIEFQMFPMGDYDYPFTNLFPQRCRARTGWTAISPTTPKRRAIGIGRSSLAGSASEISRLARS